MVEDVKCYGKKQALRENLRKKWVGCDSDKAVRVGLIRRGYEQRMKETKGLSKMSI